MSPPVGDVDNLILYLLPEKTKNVRKTFNASASGKSGVKTSKEVHVIELAQLEALGLVALSALLGAIVGLEREAKGKPAGLKTHMLVSAAATLYTLLAEIATYSLRSTPGYLMITPDPIRVIQAIVIGIGFVGGGAIIKSAQEGRVLNLTTAAAIFFTPAVGIAVGLYQIVLAVGASLLILTINLGGGWIEKKFFHSGKET